MLRTKWDSNSQGFIIQTFSKCVTSPMAVSPTYIYGSRKARTSNRIVKSYLLYHWAINPNWVSDVQSPKVSFADSIICTHIIEWLSELDSNKHRTLPKNVDLPISLSLMLSTLCNFYTYTATVLPCVAWYPSAQSRNRTKIYYLQDSRTNRCTNWAILLATVTASRRSWAVKGWSARGSNPYCHSERVECWPVAQANPTGKGQDSF